MMASCPLGRRSIIDDTLTASTGDFAYWPERSTRAQSLHRPLPSHRTHCGVSLSSFSRLDELLVDEEPGRYLVVLVPLPELVKFHGMDALKDTLRDVICISLNFLSALSPCDLCLESLSGLGTWYHFEVA